MVALAYVVERLVLRPLVNQEQIMLFMATIGIIVLPRRVRPGDLGQRRPHARTSASRRIRSFSVERLLINQFDLVAAIVAASLVAALALFFQNTGSAARCARWPTITRRRSRSAFR